MKHTDIEWTDFSANPLKYRDKSGRVVWACVKKSAGCANCYSEAIAHHYQRGGPFTRATMAELTPFLDEKDLRKILTAKTIDGEPVAGKRCFLGDMTDVFGEWVSFDLLDQLFAVMALRPDVTFQILTKRAERMCEYVSEIRGAEGFGRLNEAARAVTGRDVAILPTQRHGMVAGEWPLPNVWLGASVENQAAARERIPYLLHTPAAVRFLSCEPLLGPVDLNDVSRTIGAAPDEITDEDNNDGPPLGGLPGIDWVIVGGESGAGARPLNLDWARSLVNQCKEAGVACFVKQLGAVIHARNILDPLDQFPGKVRTHKAAPAEDTIALGLIDRKGGDMKEWPADLRVREFPTTEVV